MGGESKTLRMVDTPDKMTVYPLERCKHCGESLKQKEATEYDRRQVYDIPPIKVQVTEHRWWIPDRRKRSITG